MTAFQGFDRKLNLEENTDDRDVLNNLGVAPIADDISLFVNNLRNTSELLITADKVINNTITFNPLSQRFVFTDGTLITVFNGIIAIGNYFVGNSNNVNEFQLFFNLGLTQLATPPAGPNIRYVRSDAITKKDVLNLLKDRSPVIELQSLSQIISNVAAVEATGVGQNVPNPYVSLRQVYSRFNNSDGTSVTITQYMNAIETSIDEFQQKKSKSIINNFDFATNQKLVFDGNMIVTDPAGVNDTSVSTNSGPGIFILDITTGNPKRAFSDNENVWAEEPLSPATPTTLVGATREIVVGELVFSEGMRIIRRASLPAITPEINSADSFTHFVKITVNGQEYSLCLK